MDRKAYKYFLLVVGSILFPLGITLFINPWELNTGGLVGTSQILSYLMVHNLSLTGIFNAIVNIPLFLLAYRELSRRFVIKTALSIAIQMVMFSIIPTPATPILPDILSSLIFGSVIAGIGIGLCLQSGGCAGGIDILGVYMARKQPDFSVGKLSYAVNLVVLTVSGFLFSLQTALYSVILILLMYFAADKVHLQNINMYAMIVTDNPEVKEAILKETRRGVTYWNGKGAWTNSDKEILLCMLNRYEVRFLKKLVRSIDPKAFFILSAGTPVLGNFERRLTE